jgi:hypothetical protein
MPLEMISRRPGFALELLAWGLRGHADDYHDACLESVDLNERLPTEYRADSVISVKGPDGRKRFVIVEVQRTYKEEKVWTWAAYAGALMGRHKCGVMLVVVCLDQKTADKYRRPITSAESSLIICPVVVGPNELPILREAQDVLASPEIATLSAITRPNDVETVVAVATTLATFDDERGLIYYDYLRGQLPETVRSQLEELMIDTAPRLPDRFTEPIERAAEARGEARGEAKCLLTVLEARQLSILADQREIIESCADTGKLLSWTKKAATASSVEEIFAD